jgi:hypothetical protein
MLACGNGGKGCNMTNEYRFTVDVSDYIIWRNGELYARVSGCSAQAIVAMVDALNQMEIEG